MILDWSTKDHLCFTPSQNMKFDFSLILIGYRDVHLFVIGRKPSFRWLVHLKHHYACSLDNINSIMSLCSLIGLHENTIPPLIGCLKYDQLFDWLVLWCLTCDFYLLSFLAKYWKAKRKEMLISQFLQKDKKTRGCRGWRYTTLSNKKNVELNFCRTKFLPGIIFVNTKLFSSWNFVQKNANFTTFYFSD